MPNSGGFRSLVGRHIGGVAGQSGFVPNSGGLRSLFGRQVFGLSGSTSQPPPPPPPSAQQPSGGWVRDPWARRRRKHEDDGPPVVARDLPPDPPAEPAPTVDLAALDAQIAALGMEIEQSRKRERMRLQARLADMQAQRALAAAGQRRRQIIDDEESWFMLS